MEQILDFCWNFYDPISVSIRISIFPSVCPSRFWEVHFSTTAQPIRFKFGMVLYYGVNSRLLLKFLWSDQSIDQDIDFSARVSVTLFRGSLFNDGATDSVQIWNGVILWSKFLISVEIFMIRSVYRSGYRFFCPCVCRAFSRFTVQRRRDWFSSNMEWCCIME
jgi:hypothetical protein